MQVKHGEFVEIVYVGKLDDGTIFDLNDVELAKSIGMDPKRVAKKTIICVGEKDLVPGLDNFLIDKNLKELLHVTVTPDQAFGKKEAQLIQMMPLKRFREHNINPVPGLQINMDNMIGVVKTVSGGRVMIDFNHPLAGRTLNYDITMTRKVTDMKEKVSSFLSLNLNVPEVNIEDKEGKLTIKLPLPKEMEAPITEAIKKRVPEVKEINFTK
tara:strand:+ start:1833 stop:2468 length:636 start_codon:yes stop_codon:yes gene_type:complete